VREADKGSKTYVLETRQHVTFWPQQTGKQRYMVASIGNLPGQTKPFDFGSSHCTFLRIDNQVSEVNVPPPHAATVLRPFFRDHPREPMLEENFWTLRRKGRITKADTPTIRLGATPSGLTSAHLHHPPIFFTGPVPFLPPNKAQQATVK